MWFDTSKIPNEQEVLLGDLCVLGPAGEEYGRLKLGTVKGGSKAAALKNDGQGVILLRSLDGSLSQTILFIGVAPGSRPKKAVIKVDKVEVAAFELE